MKSAFFFRSLAVSVTLIALFSFPASVCETGTSRFSAELHPRAKRRHSLQQQQASTRHTKPNGDVKLKASGLPGTRRSRSDVCV